jgi:hypothetical protein
MVEACVPVSVMPVSVFPVTVTVAVFFTVVPLVSVTVAVIVALPAATPVTTPVVLTTVATAVFDEVQAATEVTFPVVPFPYVPVAVSCSLSPAGSDALGTVIAIERRLFTAAPPVMATTS